MIDPPRLLEEASDPFQRRLLGSARADRGTSVAQTRCIVAASTATIITTQVVASAAAAVGGSSFGIGVALKAAAIGLVLGFSVEGVVALNAHSDTTTRLLRASAASKPQAGAKKPLASAKAQPTPAPLPPETSVVISVKPAASAPNLASAPTVTANRSFAATVDLADARSAKALAGAGIARALHDDSLDREVKLLDEARRYCASGSYERAIELLNRHRQQFAAGALGPEALVIRVRVLMGQGRRLEAEDLAKVFIARNPSSPVSTRLSSMLGLEVRKSSP